ncbi:MAG: PSD1 and planctomycete cytochrome C domain-containing protein [Chthoniobacteraceae bacterium]
MLTIRTTFALLLLPLAARAITPEEAEFFEKKIRPVLAEQCYKCHGPEKQKGDVRLDSRAALLKPAEDGPIATPGKPEESELIKSIRHSGDSKMPAKGEKLPEDQIAALEEWVKMGMPWPESDKPPTPGASTEKTKSHWSWQPVQNPALPAVKDEKKWARGEIDQFILAKLEEKKIAPSPIAAKRTLIRRATYDLTGLPPSAEEIEAFEKDNSPEAYPKLIDRLLASPRYGERWGRYWLDVARYSDTKGYLAGGEERRYPFSYTYRDWVIQALNRDLPYDQFIIQQIAGDQLATEADNSPMAAQGFLTLGRRFLNSQPDIIDDRIDVVCRGLMGLSVGCARCHDHKFDPIPTKDYYALYGVFASSMERPSNEQPVLTGARDEKSDAEYRKQLAEREGEAAKFVEEKENLFAWRMLMTIGSPALLPKQPRIPLLLDRAGREALTKVRNKIDDLNAGPLAPPRAMALFDSPQPVNPHVFVRGNPARPGEQVPRRFLTVLSGGDPKPFAKGSGRLELAQSIASKSNPLTARVMVNRVWNLHFGRGLVRTPGDFGTKGEPPTHPELLDWLASRFMAENWSLKKLHRTIMVSATYQQTSDDRPDAAQADPDNRLVWKMNRRRLDFESMRDSLLACAGQLDLQMGGRGVELAAPPYATRRAVYGYIDRQNLPGVFRTFDFASPDQSSPQRFVTTVPQQALFMMNSPFVLQRAQALVAQPKYQEANAYEEQLQELYRRVLARKAEAAEVDAGLRFVMNALTNPAAREAEKPLWQYGWGGYDEGTKQVNFHPLPHFSGKSKTWQAGATLPDPQMFFVSLYAEGGHPGRDAAHAAIRRWTAPRDGVVAISGMLDRPGDTGDGVLGRIVSSRAGELLKLDVAPKQSIPTNVARVEVKAGDTIDFIVDARGNDTSDGFRWHPVIGSDDGNWDAKAQFAGPPPPRPPQLKPWEQYAQVLLETNEFAFVD